MRYEDLPAKARAQVDAELGKKPRAAKGAGSTGGPCAYRCHQCGHESPTWPKAEAHGQASGHTRQDMILQEDR